MYQLQCFFETYYCHRSNLNKLGNLMTSKLRRTINKFAKIMYNVSHLRQETLTEENLFSKHQLCSSAKMFGVHANYRCVCSQYDCQIV